MKKRLRFVLRLVLLLVAVTGIVVLATIMSLRPRSAEQMKAEMRAQLPVGASRMKVEEFMKVQGIEQFDFDYPPSDPRQGTVIVGYVTSPKVLRTAKHVCPWLVIATVHVVFYFNHNGSEGKLTQYQVSDHSIPVASP